MGRDTEGLLVISDLHGGELDDPKTQAEFHEIKERVVQDVSDSLH